MTVILGETKGQDKEFDADGVTKYIDGFSDKERRQLFGVKGAKEYRAGGDWQKLTRGWQGYGQPQGRLKNKDFKAKKLQLSAGKGDSTLDADAGYRCIGKFDFKKFVEDKKLVQETLTGFENQIVKEPIEHAIIFTRKGRAYHCVGDENNVNPKVTKDDSLEGAIVTHNHPSGNPYNEHSFSEDDIDWFLKMNFAILRGVDDKYIYELNRNPEDIDEEPTVKEALMRDMDEIDMYLARHASVIKKARQNHIGYRRWARKKEGEVK